MDIKVLLFSYPFLFIFCSFVIGSLLMPYIIKLAIAKQLIVKPNKRTSHVGGIPNIGGINIFSSFIIPYLILTAYNWEFQDRSFIAGMYFILLVGFFDDLVELSAKKKLMGEIIAGFVLIVIADIRITNLHNFLGIGEINDFLSYPLSFFIYLLIVNALNLIDGVDGLASGLGILYCTFFAVYFELIGIPSLSIIGYGMIGALMIFFIYNVFGNKNKIFMGDSGSLVLGYTLYMFVVKFCEINAYNSEHLEQFGFTTAPIICICVLALPLFDTIRVMITRIKKGHSPFVADRNHMHHLLLSTGLKHKQVTFILLIFNVSFIILGLLICNLRIELFLLIVILYACTLIYTMWKFVDKYKKNQER